MRRWHRSPVGSIGLCVRRLNDEAERLPAETNPLLNVVGERSPHRFGTDLRNSTHMEPPQPKLFLDPGIHELSNLRPLPQRSFSLTTCGLSTECRNNRMFFRDYDGSPVAGIAGTTVLALRAPFAICHACLIPHHRSTGPLFRTARSEYFPLWAYKRVRC